MKKRKKKLLSKLYKNAKKHGDDPVGEVSIIKNTKRLYKKYNK